MHGLNILVAPREIPGGHDVVVTINSHWRGYLVHMARCQCGWLSAQHRERARTELLVLRHWQATTESNRKEGSHE